MKDLLVIAGPCSVESEEQINTLAKELSEIGVTYLRGGAFKPRTSPTSFQGLKSQGLTHLIAAAKKYNMNTVSEIMDTQDLELFQDISVIQIGARNMHNSALLTAVAKRFPKKTILLKRGFSATKKEVVGALDYLKKAGHSGPVWICERGIRSFETEYSRFHLDVSFIADLNLSKQANQRIVVDPSHAGGRSELVKPLALAGIAAGADTLMVEVKEEGSTPKSDARQAITVRKLQEIIERLRQESNLPDPKVPD